LQGQPKRRPQQHAAAKSPAKPAAAKPAAAAAKPVAAASAASAAGVAAAVKSAAAALRLAAESPSRLEIDSGSFEQQSSSEDEEKEAQLRADGASSALIPVGYEKYVAPTGRVDIKFRVLVQYFYSISMREELLDFGLKVFKMWRDPRLAHQAAYEKRKKQETKDGRAHHEGTEVDPSLVWRPQSELRNAIERTVLSEELLVFPDGHVLLTQRLRVKVTVDFDMLWFPFDQQALSFVFGTFGRATTDRVQLRTSYNMTWSPAFPQSDVRQNFLIEADLLERPQQSWKVLSFYGRDRTVMGEASRLKYSEVDCI
jgi:hypothetical protein